MTEPVIVDTSMNEVDWNSLQPGDEVQFLGFIRNFKGSFGLHSHWAYRPGVIYTVGVSNGGEVGPPDDQGHIPGKNWGFAFRMVSRKTPEETERDKFEQWVAENDLCR